MACYDCKFNYQKGGKCTRWEYNCPFNHVQFENIEEQIKVLQDLNTALEIKKKILEINELWNSMNFSWSCDSKLCSDDTVVRLLDEKLDNDLIKEWKNIIE